MLPRIAFTLVLAGCLSHAQQYIITTFAGGAPPPTPVAAVNTAIGNPYSIATDASGNVYFTGLNCLFKVDQNGVLTRLAGNARPGFSGDGGPATNAQLNSPADLALDNAGNLYIADWGNNRIRKIDATGIITSVGSPFVPIGVAVDASGNIYASAPAANRVFKITPDGTQTTFAGIISVTNFHFSGDGGPATNAELSQPRGLVIDTAGNLYIADTGNNCIRKVDANGIITTVVGRGGPALGSNSILSGPIDVALGNVGDLFIADGGDNCVRKLSADGRITTVAGIPNQYGGYSGDGGPATSAQLSGPSGLAVDKAGNTYVTDAGNHRVRKVSPDGIITTAAGNGTPRYWGDGGPATDAGLSTPGAVAADNDGNVYLSDSGGERTRKVSPNGNIATVTISTYWGLSTDAEGNVYGAAGGWVDKITANGTIARVAGNGKGGYSGDGGPAVNAQFNYAQGLAVDTAGNLYVADVNNSRVRKISADGIITTVAGNGNPGYSGDGGPAISAQMNEPFSVTVDRGGNVYIADLGNSRIRMVSPAGIMTTVAGNNTQGYIGGLGVAAENTGALYVLDDPGGNGGRVRKVSPNGIISTLVNNPGNGYTGDGGPSNNGQLSSPEAIAVDSVGNIYIADTYNDAIRVLRPTTEPQPTVTAITHAASSLSAPLAPGEIFTLYGSGMGPAQLAQMHLNDKGLVDTTLAETQVTFNGIPAPIVYTSDQQLAAIVPYATKGPSADMVVTYQGHPTNPMPVLIQASSPGLFTADSTGQGQAAAINQDGTINTPTNPAAAGSYISLYATGEGATTPAGVDGKPATAPLPKPILPVTVTIAGQPAPVQYAGAAPGLVAGVMQVNAQIPANTPSGKIAVVIQVGTSNSQANVTIAVK